VLGDLVAESTNDIAYSDRRGGVAGQAELFCGVEAGLDRRVAAARCGLCQCGGRLGRSDPGKRGGCRGGDFRVGIRELRFEQGDGSGIAADAYRVDHAHEQPARERARRLS
jgi:hypothetical protein